jgi:putative membrane protein
MSLSLEDHRRIAQAVATAERASRGEIVCVVAEEAGPYAEVPLAWAAAGALTLPLLGLAVAAVLRHFDYALGGWSVAQVGALHAAVLTALSGYAVLQCLLFLGIFLVVSVPPIRRCLTPPALKRVRVRERAQEQFLVHGLDRTRERTGVLIFVSLQDRRAEVLADTGISTRVDASIWSEPVEDLVAGMRAGRPADGMVAAIGRIGRVLAEHFPATAGDTNELPDRLTETPEG